MMTTAVIGITMHCSCYDVPDVVAAAVVAAAATVQAD